MCSSGTLPKFIQPVYFWSFCYHHPVSPAICLHSSGRKCVQYGDYARVPPWWPPSTFASSEASRQVLSLGLTASFRATSLEGRPRETQGSVGPCPSLPFPNTAPPSWPSTSFQVLPVDSRSPQPSPQSLVHQAAFRPFLLFAGLSVPS